jgi:hypothetical protein
MHRDRQTIFEAAIAMLVLDGVPLRADRSERPQRARLPWSDARH